jgi:hypothetical protein
MNCKGCGRKRSCLTRGFTRYFPDGSEENYEKLGEEAGDLAEIRIGHLQNKSLRNYRYAMPHGFLSAYKYQTGYRNKSQLWN